jgi:predicted molibdopterin-dependent oxidoreductase YjgC
MENWRKSSHSSQSGGNCVEVATSNAVMIRDTTNREGFMLSVSASVWSKFTTAIK